MKLDQVFGLLLILLAIYLGVNATGNQIDDLFGGEPVDVPPAVGGSGGGGNGSSSGSSTAGNGGGNGSQNSGNGSQNGGGSQDGGTTSGNAQSGGGTGQQGQSGNGQNGQAARETVIVRSDFCAAAPDTTSYDDVGSTHDAAIACMDAAGIVEGTSETVFAPGDAVTRGEAAIAIAMMIDTANRLEVKGVDLRSIPRADDARFEDFKDASADCPGERSVARLNETTVLQGYVDARYEPCGKVTRAQMASLLDRSYQFMNRTALPIGSDQFRDDNRSVHEESINAVAAADIMNGVGNRRFNPGGSVTRAQMASYITKVMIRMEDKGRIRPLQVTP
jgi:hypothetical protein